MTAKHHYTGLTDSQVIESRAKNGINILTPPKETSVWQKIKDCMHFWLLKVYLALVIITILAVAILPFIGYHHNGLWIAPVLSFILFVLTYLVAYLGGEWNEKEKTFDIDALFTILLFALLLSGAIAFYNGVYGGIKGWEPYLELIGIAVAVLLATTVAHILESQNEKTFKSLNEVNDDILVKVIRNNNVCQVLRKNIVVGDIILLDAGEEIPADAELLQCMNLIVNESSLTGETQCAKTTNPDEFDKDATYPSNHIMKGCTVMEGDCIARVFAVGDATACGKVFEAAQVREGEATPLSKQLDDLAELITKTSYGLAVLIILGRLVRYAIRLPNTNVWSLTGYLISSLLLSVLIFFWLNKNKNADNEENISLCQILVFMILPIISVFMYFAFGTEVSTNWSMLIQYALESVMIAVTLIVVAVPEGLPMAVTLSLAFSMKRLMKQNTLPRTMHACETMGAVSVICSDKTGTLTQNQMKVVDVLFPCIESEVLGNDSASLIVKECIAINTTANLDFTDPKKVKAIGNPTEGALLLWLHTNGVNYLDIRESISIIDRLQFTTELKYMATIVHSQVIGKRCVYVKGAPEIIMSLCNISKEQTKIYSERLNDYQSHANRTLAFAYKELTENDNIFKDGKIIINDLKMIGIVGIEDPVRSDVSGAINECLNAGIQVKIVTGDAPGTAKEIGRQIGLWTMEDTDENILIGSDIIAMNDEEMKRRLPKIKIISRAKPNDKERVVKLLKELDYVVAVTGNGTNDAPALNVANVGLSMGDGTAVAKEASDITIIDNSFNTIANAVMWGRSLYKNIQRFLLFQLTVNVTACFLVLFGAFLGTQSPLTVTQMLWVNLIMDTFAAIALSALPPQKSVMTEKPRNSKAFILDKNMLQNIFGVGGFFFIMLLGLLLIFQHSDVTSIKDLLTFSFGEESYVTTYELTLLFTIFVITHMGYMFNARAYKTGGSGWNLKKCNGFLLIATVVTLGQIAIVQVPLLNDFFNVQSLPLLDWIVIFIIGFMVTGVREVKHLITK